MAVISALDVTPSVIVVSAALITDEDGRLLLVRKRGTVRFMQAGGKPEGGETAEEALVRELQEELELTVSPAALRPIGRFVATAANEPGHVVHADVFGLLVTHPVAAAAELAEVRWCTPLEADRLGDLLAPLARTLLGELDRQ